MKLKNPITFIGNLIRDIYNIRDFIYKLPNKTQGDFWKE